MALRYVSDRELQEPKIVPTLMENCSLQSKHLHMSRMLRNETRLDWHCGQTASPFSQRSPSEKLHAAERIGRNTGWPPIRVAGTFTVASMNQEYPESLGEPSDVLRNVSAKRSQRASAPSPPQALTLPLAPRYLANGPRPAPWWRSKGLAAPDSPVRCRFAASSNSL